MGETAYSGAAAIGGRALALAIAFASLLRFSKWMLEFASRRYDVNRSALGERVKHLERELDAYREVAMLMIGVVAKVAPHSEALGAAARILRTIPPRAKLELDEILAGLGKMEGTRS